MSLFKEFDGNTDGRTVVSNDLIPPIRARYIRFRPLAWHWQIAMRVELYGCHGNKVVSVIAALVVWLEIWIMEKVLCANSFISLLYPLFCNRYHERKKLKPRRSSSHKMAMSSSSLNLATPYKRLLNREHRNS